MKSINKLFIINFIIIIFPQIICAQKITSKINKRQFHINEIISLTYFTDIQIDSISTKNFKDFDIVKNSTAINRYYNNGKRGVKQGHFFKLKAKKSGMYNIPSPFFYLKGMVLKTKSIRVEVSHSKKTNIDTTKVIEKSK